jgi:CDP-glucose 4,6-dehydratase
VCITTDKVYENREWIWGYRENDPLGGHDPYSTSKAMAELAIASYRRSFFPAERFHEHRVAIASARAGNVIGGGDWAAHRLIPDCARALMAGEPIHLRNPDHVRPWQHVLESLSAYLWLGAKLAQDDGHCFAEAWNFGPYESSRVTTEEVVKKAIQLWGEGTYTSGTAQTQVETGLLKLNWEKASNYLEWHSAYSWDEALAATVDWYMEYHRQNTRAQSIDMHPSCVAQIRAYTERARELGIAWAT